MDDLAVQAGHHRLNLPDFRFGYSEVVAIQHHKIRVFPSLQTPQIVLGQNIVAHLEQEADGGEAAIPQKLIPPEDDPSRIHERGSGGPA